MADWDLAISSETPYKIAPLYGYLSFWSAVTRRRFYLPGRVPVAKARTCPRTSKGTDGTTITVKKKESITVPDTDGFITRLTRPKPFDFLIPPCFFYVLSP